MRDATRHLRPGGAERVQQAPPTRRARGGIPAAPGPRPGPVPSVPDLDPAAAAARGMLERQLEEQLATVHASAGRLLARLDKWTDKLRPYPDADENGSAAVARLAF